MPEFFNYDPVTGVTEYFDYDEATGNASIRFEQDIEKRMDYLHEVRASRNTDKGIKESFWLFAELGPIEQIELRQKGLDIYSKDPTMIKRVCQEIQANYPKCMTTEKKIWIPQSKSSQSAGN